MSVKRFKFLSGIFFIAGAFLLLDFKINLTGAVIGISNISSFFIPVFGLILISISIVLFFGGESLEKIVDQVDGMEREVKKKSQKIPAYNSLEEGIANSPEGTLFYADIHNKRNDSTDRALFCYASSKEDAAKIASRFNPTGIPIYEFMDEGLRKKLKKKGQSVDKIELERELKEYLLNNLYADTRIKKIGFGSRQKDTKEGRLWEKYARYDSPHSDLGIPYSHYNIYSTEPEYNIHCLIVPKNKLKKRKKNKD